MEGLCLHPYPLHTTRIYITPADSKMDHTSFNPSIRLFDPPPHDEPFNPGQRDDVLNDIAALEDAVRANVNILAEDIGWDTSIEWSPASQRPGVTDDIFSSNVCFRSAFSRPSTYSSRW